MGALHTLNVARANGARVVSIDPRMPDISYGDVDWVGIRPSTDAAFVMGLINRMIQDGTADFDFIQKHTNGAYLVRENGHPLTQADFVAGGDKTKYAVANAAGEISFRGLKKNETGEMVLTKILLSRLSLKTSLRSNLSTGSRFPLKPLLKSSKRQRLLTHRRKYLKSPALSLASCSVSLRTSRT